MGDLRRAADVRKALESKGMSAHNGRHHIMLIKKIDGLLQFTTHISFNSKEIDDYLAGNMADQCGLRAAEFGDLVDCPLSEEGWEKIARERCKDGRNPFLRYR